MLYIINAQKIDNIIYENSLSKYADDTTLLAPQHTNCDIEIEFEHIRQWSAVNKLTINKAKGVKIIFWRTTRIKCRYTVNDIGTRNSASGICETPWCFLLLLICPGLCRLIMCREQYQRFFYLIKQIRSMSLNMVSMNQIYNALVLSQIQYPLPAYYGFLLQADKDRIDALMRKAKRWALTSLTIGIDVLAQSADSTLFLKAVQAGRCLHPLVPNKSDNRSYNLRSNHVLYNLPLIKHSGLEKSFIYRCIRYGL